jgi:hypothetical protein
MSTSTTCVNNAQAACCLNYQCCYEHCCDWDNCECGDCVECGGTKPTERERADVLLLPQSQCEVRESVLHVRQQDANEDISQGINNAIETSKIPELPPVKRLTFRQQLDLLVQSVSKYFCLFLPLIICSK